MRPWKVGLCAFACVFGMGCHQNSSSQAELSQANPATDDAPVKTTEKKEPINDAKIDAKIDKSANRDTLVEESSNSDEKQGMEPKPRRDPSVSANNRVPRDFDSAKLQLTDNPLLSMVPDSSFFLLASGGVFDLKRREFADFFEHLSVLLSAELKKWANDDRERKTPFVRALLSYASGVMKGFSPQKLVSLGLSDGTMMPFVFYFEQNIPVLRLRVSDDEKFRSVFQSYLAQNDVTPERLDLGAFGAWTLYDLGYGEARLAASWTPNRVLTLTFISSALQAESYLPRLRREPDKGRSALDKLQKIEEFGGRLFVGVFDLGQFRNSFVALESQLEKIAGRTTRTDKTCAKEFQRLTRNIQSITLGVMPKSTGKSVAMETVFRVHMAAQKPLKEVFASRFYRLSMPKADHDALAEFSASFPLREGMPVLRQWQTEIQKSPFQCQSFLALNSIVGMDLGAFGGTENWEDDHYVGGVLVDGSFEKPKAYSAYYVASAAAQNALHFGLIDSKQLKATLEDARENNIEDKTKNGDNLEFGAMIDDKNAKSFETPDDLETYEDATIALSGEIADLSNAKLLVQDNLVAVATDSAVLTALKEAELEEAPMVHVGWSERLASFDKRVKRDNDAARFYHHDVSLELGTQEKGEFVQVSWIYQTE